MSRIITGLVGLLALLVFYRAVFLSGFDLLPGDIGDTRFNMVILEHWFRVAQGLDSGTSPNFFFPAPGTLGYSDALILLAIPYVASRLIGLGVLHSTQWTLLAWSLLGFTGMFLWLRRPQQLALPASLAGAVAFAFGTQFYQGLALGHIQLMTALLLPWLASGVWCQLKNTLDNPSRHPLACGVGAAALLALMLLTSFYVGWFVMLQGLVMAMLAIFALFARRGVRQGFLAVRVELARQWPGLAVGAWVLMAGLLPFAMIYGPILQQGVERDWSVVARYLPFWTDLHDPKGNLLWEPVAQTLAPWLTSRKDELGKGLTWGLLAIFCATLIQTGFARRPPLTDPTALRQHRMVLLFGGSVIVCWILMLKVGEVSLWALVYHWVPGAIAIRTVHRFNGVLAFSVVTVAAMGLDRLWRQSGNRRPAQIAVLALAALIAFEQINRLPKFVSQRADMTPLETFAAAPPHCRAFVLLPSDRDPRWHHWSRQLEAVVIAQRQNLPTLNGESGGAPPGWHLFDPSDSPAYEEALVSWADRYQLWDGLCGLDPVLARWFPVRRHDGVIQAPGRL
ncbi:MAG: hypothetical protein WCP34_00195 [Pseudomonadota bacterium]